MHTTEEDYICFHQHLMKVTVIVIVTDSIYSNNINQI